MMDKIYDCVLKAARETLQGRPHKTHTYLATILYIRCFSSQRLTNRSLRCNQGPRVRVPVWSYTECYEARSGSSVHRFCVLPSQQTRSGLLQGRGL